MGKREPFITIDPVFEAFADENKLHVNKNYYPRDYMTTRSISWSEEYEYDKSYPHLPKYKIMKYISVADHGWPDTYRVSATACIYEADSKYINYIQGKTKKVYLKKDMTLSELQSNFTNHLNKAKEELESVDLSYFL